MNGAASTAPAGAGPASRYDTGSASAYAGGARRGTSRGLIRRVRGPGRWLGIALLARVLGLGLLAMFAGAALASAPGVPALIADHVPQARLLGQGTLRMYGFHIYDAQFFVGPDGFSAQRMTTEPFALDMVYARSFKGSSIAAKGREEMDDMHLADHGQTRAWEQRMAAIFPDVRAGDRLTGIFVPDKGTTFYLNSRPIGKIAGDDFARAFFSIWLAPQTSAPKLRQDLLGQSNAS